MADRRIFCARRTSMLLDLGRFYAVMMLLGTEFDHVTLEVNAQFILAHEAREASWYIITPKADHLDGLRHIPALSRVYYQALQKLLDSRLITKLCRFIGSHAPPVVTDADFGVAFLLRLGGRQAVVIGMSAGDISVLQTKYPEIIIVHRQPPMGLMRDRAGFEAAVAFRAGLGAEICSAH